MKNKSIILDSNNVIPELYVLQSDTTTVINPQFISATGEMVTFEVNDHGIYTGPMDENINFYLKWDSNNIYLEVIDHDETHSVQGQSDWDGDALQLMIADKYKTQSLLEISTSFYGKNAEYNLDEAIHNMVRWNKSKYYKDGIVLLIHNSQTNNNDSLIDYLTINRDEVKQETTYKLSIPYKYIQSSPFKNGQSFGFGLMINDGDYVDEGDNDGFEIAHVINKNNTAQVIQNQLILQQKPLSITLKIVNIFDALTYILLKKESFEIRISNMNLYINNNLIKTNTSRNILLVININTTSNVFYCPINDTLDDVEDILDIDITNNFNIELFSNNSNILLGKEVTECKISNRILLNGIHPGWDTQNEEPNSVRGQRGWAGWFPESLRYPPNPTKTGLINLIYGREYNYILSGDVIIKNNNNNNNNNNEYKITFSKKNISKVLMYQSWAENVPELNVKRKVKYINVKKWIKSSFPDVSTESNPFTPSAVMQLDNGRQIVVIINRAVINSNGRVVFYVTTNNLNAIKKIKLGSKYYNTQFIIGN